MWVSSNFFMSMVLEMKLDFLDEEVVKKTIHKVKWYLHLP